MLLKKIPLADTHAFNAFFLDYIQQKETLEPFYNRFPHIDNFKAQLEEKAKSFPNSSRSILVQALTRQYGSLRVNSLVESNIKALADSKTFTITTGHQLNIFTGPAYFIYKIITVINTCKQLKEKYPDYKFIPVYWMASEDHDYDEIKYFRLYNKKYVWETNQQGAVGRFLTKDLEALFKDIPGDVSLFKEAYKKNKTLSGAVRNYVNTLFSNEGLLVLDADDSDLKKILKPVIQEDIIKNTTKPIVEKTNSLLEGLGYKTQIFCRDINFFYLDNNVRNRIQKEGDVFKVVDTDISFSESEIASLIEKSPEKFSPNVILRPLYQEMLLPNIAYIGGPAEVVYWLQLKDMFGHFKVPFPILMPRNFAMVVEHQVLRKFEKINLEWSEIFEEKNYLFNHWVLKYSPRNLTVGEERNQAHALFTSLKERANSIDKTLSAYVGAQGKRALNSLDNIERKFIRAEKRLQADKLRQIESVKDALFPNGSLQERTDNFLNFYQTNPNFIQDLISQFNPLDFHFNILIYDTPA